MERAGYESFPRMLCQLSSKSPMIGTIILPATRREFVMN